MCSNLNCNGKRRGKSGTEDHPLEKCRIQHYQNKEGCQHMGQFYYSENLNWATQNLRLVRGLDIAELDTSLCC